MIGSFRSPTYTVRRPTDIQNISIFTQGNQYGCGLSTTFFTDLTEGMHCYTTLYIEVQRTVIEAH